eukprot:3783906-Ditylum_brightwellii.AAC.1
MTSVMGDVFNTVPTPGRTERGNLFRAFGTDDNGIARGVTGGCSGVKKEEGDGTGMDFGTS